MRQAFVVPAVLFAAALTAHAQTKTSSSSQTDANGSNQVVESTSRPPSARNGAADAAITLETSETLFDMGVALNACGYDRGLEDSAHVRAEVRAEVDRSTAELPAVKTARAAMCNYFHEHELSDKSRELAQYVSLALYTTPPPELKPAADITEMPPDAAQVAGLLPLLHDFASAMVLHELWQKHHLEYEAVTGAVHDSVTKMIQDTNVYLRMPVSSYDGRRFLILLEPMLPPKVPNGRVYGTDYIIVDSPTGRDEIRMDQIRHIYLQYMIDPLVYARASSMVRLQPLLKPVQSAPLEFAYKSDISLLVTECLIKAIEARTMDVGFPEPQKPERGTKDRQVLMRYEAEMQAYARSAEEVRRRTVDLDMRQGWAMTNYFYEDLIKMERDGSSLQEDIAEMVYGMDVLRVAGEESSIAFLPATAQVSGDFVKRAPRPLTPMMQAEKMMLEGNVDGARAIAQRVLDDPSKDHAEANYVMARVQLMQNEPSTAMDTFAEVIRSSENPHTVAWAHIYRGRLYDTAQVPSRQRAISEYKAALQVPGVTPDARYAAQDGIKQAYELPKGPVHTEVDEDAPLDPSGKAEKDSYKPDEM